MKENKNFKRLVIFTMVTMMCMTVLAVGCYGECCGELPNNGQSAGGINMADNEVLYHFNNQGEYGESGTYIHDFSGSGHYGNVPTGKSAGYVPNGKFCGAVEFDGTHISDHRIFIKDGMEFWDNAEHWSVVMWINASATLRNIIGKVGSCTPWIWIGNNYRIGFASFYGVSPPYTEGVSSTLPYAVDPNQWTHLVMTRNGTNLSVYKNGVLHTSLTATTTQNGNLGGVGDLQIGACGSSGCRLKGLLDELAFFSRTLSPDEIYNMYEWNGDGTPPTTTKAYGVPFYTDGVDDWITTATPITLTAVDEGLCADGVMEIRYNYGDGWMVAPGDAVTFIIPDECTHLIEYYSVDNVGNTETTKSQIVNVDDTPPTSNISYSQPYFNDWESILNDNAITPDDALYKIDPEDIPLFVTTDTHFQLTAEDKGKCPVGVVDIFYRTWNLYDGWSDWTVYKEEKDNPYETHKKGFTLNYEGLHYIEYYAEDLLGNTEKTIHKLSCMVDDTPPRTVGYGYMSVILDATDYGGKHVSDILPFDDLPEFLPVWLHHIHYRYKIGERGRWTEWQTGDMNRNVRITLGPGDMYGTPIYVDYYAVDILGNTEETHHDVFTNDLFPGPAHRLKYTNLNYHYHCIKAEDETVDWTISISIDGRVFMGGQASGTIAAGSIQTVKLPFSLGIGMVDITVTANSVTKEATAFMLGPLVLSLKEI